MDFADPWLLALGAAVLPLAVLAWWRRPVAHVLPSTTGIAALRPTWRLRAARLLPLFRLLAVALLAVAVARPRAGEANAVVPAQGIDIALSVDVSSSMITSKFPDGRDRLTVTKRVIRDFIKGRENDRIGFVVFQQDALALAPPTLDYEVLDRIVAQTESGILPDGTGIGVGLATALNMLRDSTAASRVVILLTDGEHNAQSISPEQAADVATALRIRVYTIGVTGGDAPGGRGALDEARMRAISEQTGGQYFSANSPDALADVYEEIGKLETSRVGNEMFDRYSEYGWWFAGGAALLVFAELALRATWLRRAPG
ncbi:MAG: VWA domain-containing protein [Chloroflexi bacterium]|nr:VWA domain-containing protein [Chloroflexota bacterium]